MAFVRVSGPLFDGLAQREVTVMTVEIVREVAQEAKLAVDKVLSKELQNPTGHYQRQIAVTRVGTSNVVTDGGIVYGPWLAGASSRTWKSRFKGYKHWTLAKQRTQRKVQKIGEPIVHRHVQRMNGG